MAQLPIVCHKFDLGGARRPAEHPDAGGIKCRRCRGQSLFFLVPVGMEEGVATVPNRMLRGEAASWHNCHLFVPSVTTWEELLGPSEHPYAGGFKCRRCRGQSLFFLVPVGMEEGVATVPNRMLQGEAASWHNCHLFVPSVTWEELLGP